MSTPAANSSSAGSTGSPSSEDRRRIGAGQTGGGFPAGIFPISAHPHTSALAAVKWLVLATALAALALAVLYLRAAAPLHTSYADLLINMQSLNTSARRPAAPIPAAPGDGPDRQPITNQIGFANDQAMMASQVRIAASMSIIGKVFNAQNLERDPEYTRPETGWLARTGSILGVTLVSDNSATDASGARLQAQQRFAQSVSAKRLGNSYVIRIAVTSSQRDKSKRLAAALAQAFIDDSKDARMNAARLVNQILDKRLGTLRDRLRQAEKNLASAQQAYRAGLGEGVLVDEQRLKDASAVLKTARAAAQIAKRNDRLIRGALRSGRTMAPVPARFNSPYLRQLRNQYARLANRHAALSASLLPRHPRIIEIRRRLSTVRAMIRSQLGRIAPRVRRARIEADARIEALKNQLNRLKTATGRSVELRTKLAELTSDVQIARLGVNTFLARPVDLSSRLATLLPVARIISPASYPMPQTGKPELIALLIMALVAGLGLAVVYALFSRRRAVPDQSQNISSSLKSPPRTDAPQRIERANPAKAASTSSTAHANNTGDEFDGGHENDTDDAAIAQDAASNNCQQLYNGGPPARVVGAGKNRATEQATKRAAPPPTDFAAIIDALAAPDPDARSAPALQFSAQISSLLSRLHRPQIDRSQIILLQSPTPGEGHSTLALALALRASAHNHRVLLVDADHTTGALTQAFAMKIARPSFPPISPEPNLADFLVQDEESGLHLLPFSALSSDAHDTAQTRSAVPHDIPIGALSALAGGYELTIIDGGAALDHERTRELVRLADQVLICDKARPGAKGDTNAAWQVLSCKRVQGAAIVATIGEPS